MRLTFERTGGFAGIRKAKSFDSSSLSTEEANELRELIETADFFHLPGNITSTSQADRFQYKLTVEDNDLQHTVLVSEQAAPASLKPLLAWLTAAKVK